MRTYKEMEREFYRTVRAELVGGLQQCSSAQQFLFKRMYANGKLESPIEVVVGHMPKADLRRAMQQVQATLDKKIKGEEG